MTAQQPKRVFRRRSRTSSLQREEQIAQLRLVGLSTAEIAARVGMTVSGTGKALRRIQMRAIREPYVEALCLELARLDTLQTLAWSIMQSGHPQDQLRAIQVILQIIDRRVAIAGLSDKRGSSVTVEDIDREIQRLTQDLARQDKLLMSRDHDGSTVSNPRELAASVEAMDKPLPPKSTTNGTGTTNGTDPAALKAAVEAIRAEGREVTMQEIEERVEHEYRRTHDYLHREDEA